jgi:hypothetical protein
MTKTLGSFELTVTEGSFSDSEISMPLVVSFYSFVTIFNNYWCSCVVGSEWYWQDDIDPHVGWFDEAG